MLSKVIFVSDKYRSDCECAFNDADHGSNKEIQN